MVSKLATAHQLMSDEKINRYAHYNTNTHTLLTYSILVRRKHRPCVCVLFWLSESGTCLMISYNIVFLYYEHDQITSLRKLKRKNRKLISSSFFRLHRFTRCVTCDIFNHNFHRKMLMSNEQHKWSYRWNDSTGFVGIRSEAHCKLELNRKRS